MVSIAAGLWAVGLPLIVIASPEIILAGLLAFGWAGLGIRSLQNQRATQRDFSTVRIYADGSIRIRYQHRSWLAADLAAGSVVLRHIAWLRMRLDTGGFVQELIIGEAVDDEAWRRFQVIWWHYRA
ncbi:MAG: hypothetical protein AAF351_12830 [Pseudomonadota bacterium]